MRGRWLTAALCLALAPVLAAQEKEKPKPEPSVQEAFQAIMKELRQKQQEDIQAYQAAKSDADREKALESYVQKANGVADKVLELVKKNPKDANSQLAWLISNTSGKEADEAISILLKDHAGQAGQVVHGLARAPFKHVEKTIRTLRDKSTDRAAKGNATLALAQFLMGKAERSEKDRDKLHKEAEALFEEVTEKYGHLDGPRGKLADAAKTQLFELKHLSVGKVAPDIEGEDIDGKAFKLSDYRGKVVLLDFWGHW